MALRPQAVVALCAALLLAAAGSAFAVAGERAFGDARTAHAFLYCACSPSGRGAGPLVSRALAIGLVRARRVNRRAAGQGASRRFAGAARALGTAMAACARAHGHEACVNADAVGRRVYCTHDRASGAALARAGDALREMPACDGRNDTRSPMRALALIPRESPDAPVETPEPRDPRQSPAPARVGASEGCVAVEHLQGLVLQHPRHLRRRVLCGRGFCATPNHAIIVHGQWTSMRRLCAPRGEWRCVESVKFVNNLKVAANRRAIVNKLITITPYDARFPKFAVWAVQIVEDAATLVFQSIALAVLAAACVALHAEIVNEFRKVRLGGALKS